MTIIINGLNNEPKLPVKPLDTKKPIILECYDGFRHIVFLAYVGKEDIRPLSFNETKTCGINRQWDENLWDYVNNGTIREYIEKRGYKIIDSEITVTIDCKIL